MSRGKWSPRDQPAEYRERAPLHAALMDMVAASNAYTHALAHFAELIYQAETGKPHQSTRTDAA